MCISPEHGVQHSPAEAAGFLALDAGVWFREPPVPALGDGLRILHTSDLHLRHDTFTELLERLARDDYDVWVDSGDLLPDTSQWDSMRRSQAAFQRHWLEDVSFRPRVAEALRGRSAVFAPGNHDAVRIPSFGPYVDGLVVNDYGFYSEDLVDHPTAGFNCDNDYYTLVMRIEHLLEKARVLVTHAPPQGSLAAYDGRSDWGCPALAQALRTLPADKQLLVLCGHIHDPVARRVDYYVPKITIVNSATQYQVFEVY